MREIAIGILASMFFAVTFILNRSMELAGGSWMWSSSLRFLFMIPFLLLIVLVRRNMKQVFTEMRRNPFQWLLWSFVGFVLFYAPLTYAAAYGAGWLVAGTWQMTIVGGIIVAPLFYSTVQTSNGPIKKRHRIQTKALLISIVILAGVMLIQWQKANEMTVNEVMIGILPVLFAAIAYPLGNRKMMELCDGRLDTFQRVLGMTLGSTPFWIILSVIAWNKVGIPSGEQLTQSLIVAICSGVIATTLFFIATDRVRLHQGKLASVEATQSTQVLFVIAGEGLLLSSPLPTYIAWVGIALIIVGIVLHSFNVKKLNESSPPDHRQVDQQKTV
ncbi:multidrug resistance efflux transporter family protein [Alkalihalobacillus hwajinpoensis]|uniref:DMT family transporter n=1 Tax=Guptibacillus hwajinpoensis TaxID=208199 RepID=UPI0018842822|nr:multidrug resistance efflux transporter family protein [Pseudalkalibacillus hwajinpoensis]MBF0707943.1 multidrug resistance efflux transporter family protein [Pseudalkalibacillus hwajinpoensis]